VDALTKDDKRSKTGVKKQRGLKRAHKVMNDFTDVIIEIVSDLIDEGF